MAVKTITRDELVNAVNEVLARHGIGLIEFVAAGAAGELEDEELRDLWLSAGPALRPSPRCPTG